MRSLSPLLFDALVSRAGRLLRDGHMTVSSPLKIDHKQVRFRFLDESVAGSKVEWLEKPEKHRTYRRASDLAVLRAQALARAQARREVLVRRSAASLPVEWEVTE